LQVFSKRIDCKFAVLLSRF